MIMLYVHVVPENVFLPTKVQRRKYLGILAPLSGLQSFKEWLLEGKTLDFKDKDSKLKCLDLCLD